MSRSAEDRHGGESDAASSPSPGEHHRPQARRNRLLAGAAAVLVAAGAVLLLLAATRGPDLPPAPAVATSGAPPTGAYPSATSSRTTTTSSPSATAAPTTTAPHAPLLASDPTQVVIPSIGVDASLVQLGLTSTGALEVPRGPVPAGWFTGSPTPGADGPSVIAGHVTYNGARGVFFRLGALRPGALVEVKRADGVTAVFTVTSVASYAKDTFPTGVVYGHTDGPELRLITCAGDFDPVHHYYPDNLVVSARLTGQA